MTSLSIVIPVYNAEKTIDDLCRALIALLADDYLLEIVMVNDCSKDGTDAVCKALQAEYPDTIVYARLSRNFSEHNAVMAGLNQTHGDYVVIMDDDFQNPPEEVPSLLAEIQKGYDVVYSQYSVKNDSLFRNLGSYLNGSMARVILNKPANLYLSSFKAMNRFLVNEVIAYKNPRPYLDAIILRITHSIGTVEVRHDLRRAGRSGYTLKKLAALWGDMIVSYSLIPLRVVAILGVILTLLGSYSVAEMLIQNLNPSLQDPSDLEELTSISTFFRGFQLFATGIVGEYVGRIYLKLNQEPQYIIREKLSELPDRRTGGGNRRGTA
jgi:undecaprenyl-phosphate 4-deoxy-4-formamido-L-arabinose transferase